MTRWCGHDGFEGFDGSLVQGVLSRGRCDLYLARYHTPTLYTTVIINCIMQPLLYVPNSVILTYDFVII